MYRQRDGNALQQDRTASESAVINGMQKRNMYMVPHAQNKHTQATIWQSKQKERNEAQQKYHFCFALHVHAHGS